MTCSKIAARASSRAAAADVDRGAQQVGRLLGLDDGLEGQRQLVVELQAVAVDDRLHGTDAGRERAAVVAIDQELAQDAVHVVTEGGLVEAFALVAEGDDGAGDGAAVDRPQPVDEVEQVEPLLLGELAHEAEVEEDDATGVGIDQDVAGVRIAVEEAVDEDLLDEGSNEGRAELGGVEASLA